MCWRVRMGHTSKLTKYVANFVDELYCSGVHHVVISPGSRSTPLALLFSEHDGIKEWVLVDERSAAFFALGMARESNNPVALVCTSGTAAANYYPAVIEAFTQRVPLIVLTADRPHELRDVGAPQTINQIHLYGNFVKWFQEMSLPDDSEGMLDYVRSRAARAVFEAMKVGNPGPVHLNFPFREPLVPDVNIENLWGKSCSERKTYYPALSGTKQLHEQEIVWLKEMLLKEKDGIIVCGTQFDMELIPHIVALSKKLNVPILADPLSQLRAGKHERDTIVDGYDAIFRKQQLRQQLKPSFIIRFGAMPTSKSYLHFVTEHKEIPHFIVEDDSGVREPTNYPAHFLLVNGRDVCKQLIYSIPEATSNSWLLKWQKLNAIVQHNVLNIKSDNITEGEAVRELLDVIPNESTLFVSNSMPVRDLDTFFTTMDKSIQLYANRGVSGIDGINSTALGITAANLSKRVTLVIGDLSFYHDMTGLLAAKKYSLSMTILLINNDGGGIFSFLPQANEKKHFEALFGTPLNIDFSNVVQMYGGFYQLVETSTSLREALEDSYQDRTGLLAAKKYSLSMTILLINNDGGGIFSFLPQANEKKHFEALFGTPLNIDFSNVVQMYGGFYQLVETSTSLREALEDSYHREGLSVIEVKTNREENAKWHRQLWNNINKELNQCN